MSLTFFEYYGACLTYIKIEKMLRHFDFDAVCLRQQKCKLHQHFYRNGPLLQSLSVTNRLLKFQEGSFRPCLFY